MQNSQTSPPVFQITNAGFDEDAQVWCLWGVSPDGQEWLIPVEQATVYELLADVHTGIKPF